MVWRRAVFFFALACNGSAVAGDESEIFRSGFEDGPVVAISAPGNGASVCAPVSIVFDTLPSSAAVTWSCALDDGPFEACAEPQVSYGLASGAHTVRVRARDAAGNDGYATVDFTIDTTGPAMSGLVATSGAQNSGAFTVGFAANADAASVDGGVALALATGGQQLLDTCACTGTSCTCGGLAAGVNSVYVRGTDACGNAGAPVATTTFASYGPYAGHAVLIGHSYTSSATADELIANAVTAIPFVQRQLAIGRADARVLHWRPGGNALTITRLAYEEALGSSSYTHSLELFTDDTQLATLLPGRDVLLLHDPGTALTAQQLDDLGVSWAPVLRTFVDAGGIVIALNGSTGTTPNRVAGGTWRVVRGGAEPLIGVTNALPRRNATGFEIAENSQAFPPSVSGVAPFHVAVGMAESYAPPAASACFALADAEAAIVFENRARECSIPNDPEGCGGGGTGPCPAVIDKRFPAFRVDVGVMGDVAPDPDPMDTLCNPPLPPITGLDGGGTFALAAVTGGPLTGDTYACVLGDVGTSATTGRPLRGCAVASNTFTYLVPGADVALFPELYHVDITALVDGEPVRTGRGSVVIDNQIGVSNPGGGTACAPRYVVSEFRPVQCTGNFPFASVTCVLEQDLGGGGFRLVATKSGAACGAVADSRGGFQSGVAYQVDWTSELAGQPSGSYRTTVTVGDFHGNSAVLLRTGCAL